MAVKFSGIEPQGLLEGALGPRIEGRIARLAHLLEIGEPELGVGVGIGRSLAHLGLQALDPLSGGGAGELALPDRHLRLPGQARGAPVESPDPEEDRDEREERRRQFHRQAVSSDRHRRCLDARPAPEGTAARRPPLGTFGSGRGDPLALAATGDAATESGQGEHASPDQDPDDRVRSTAAATTATGTAGGGERWGRRAPVPVVDGLDLRAKPRVRVRTGLRRRDVRERAQELDVVLVHAVPERERCSGRGQGPCDDLQVDVDHVVGEPRPFG